MLRSLHPKNLIISCCQYGWIIYVAGVFVYVSNVKYATNYCQMLMDLHILCSLVLLLDLI